MTTEQTYVPRVRQRYLDEVGPQLASEFGHDNRMQWPTLSKIAVKTSVSARRSTTRTRWTLRRTT